MSPFYFRAAIASVLLSLGGVPVASAQISLGIGSAAHREAETHILRQLASRDSFVYNEMPLSKLAPLLRDRFAINVVLDHRALDDFGIDPTTPVSVDLWNTTLESTLNLVLDSLELTWTMQHEALVITTPEAAESRFLKTRVYPVRDLVLYEFERTVEADFDSLIMMITSAIQPDSWDQVGGPGAIEPELASLSLVISQTWPVHRQLEQLLTTLRAARDRQGIAVTARGSQSAAAALTPQPKATRRYHAATHSSWQLPRVYDH